MLTGDPSNTDEHEQVIRGSTHKKARPIEHRKLNKQKHGTAVEFKYEDTRSPMKNPYFNWKELCNDNKNPSFNQILKGLVQENSFQIQIEMSDVNDQDKVL